MGKFDLPPLPQLTQDEAMISRWLLETRHALESARIDGKACLQRMRDFLAFVEGPPPGPGTN